MSKKNKSNSSDKTSKTRLVLILLLLFLCFDLGVFVYFWQSEKDKAESLESEVSHLDAALKDAGQSEGKALLEAREARRRAQAAEEALRMAETQKIKEVPVERAPAKEVVVEQPVVLEQPVEPKPEVVVSKPEIDERSQVQVPSFNRKRRDRVLWQERAE